MPGCRQLAQDAMERDEEPGVDRPTQATGSFLASLLLYFWAWGLMSPQTIQKITDAVMKDLDRMQGPGGQAVRAEIAALAKLGTSGDYANNVNRDLNTYLGTSKLSLTTVPMTLEIDAATGAGAAATINQLMLLPHVLFAAVGNFFPKAWEQLVCPSRERLTEFWTNMAGSPQLKST